VCEITTEFATVNVEAKAPDQARPLCWIYELKTVAVSVLFVQAGRFEHRADLWHPKSHASSKRFQIADFMYSRRATERGGQSNTAQQSAPGLIRPK
jgi:hypothetical protein